MFPNSLVTSIYPQIYAYNHLMGTSKPKNTNTYTNTKTRRDLRRDRHYTPRPVRHRTHNVPNNEDRCIAITKTGDQCKLYKKKEEL
jgi:hypothetical protein